jgi:hypothetical protein
MGLLGSAIKAAKAGIGLNITIEIVISNSVATTIPSGLSIFHRMAALTRRIVYTRTLPVAINTKDARIEPLPARSPQERE